MKLRVQMKTRKHTIQAEEHHLRLSRPQNQVTELIHLHTGLEWQLQLTTLDDDVGEIEQMNLKRVKHTLSGDNDLLGLFFHGQRTNEGSYFFGCLPLGQLTETLLTSPDAGVNDFQEELTCSWVEYEDRTVDGFRSQVTLKSLVDCDAVDVRVVNKPCARKILERQSHKLCWKNSQMI